MKYIQIIFKLILCFILIIIMTVLSFYAIFRLTVTEKAFLGYADNETFLAAQKTKVKQDLGTIISSNNLDKSLFENAVTDQLIWENNQQYVKGFFSYLDGKSAQFQKTTAAADQYEENIKKILTDYGNKVDPDRYQITVAGIDSFASLTKSSFFSSAVPVLGFDRGAAAIKKIYQYSTPACLLAVAAILLLLFLIFLLDRRNSKLTATFLLYAVCSSGILMFLVSLYGKFVFGSAHSIFSPSYLGAAGTHLFNVSLITGIVLFAVTQILLGILLLKSKNKKS